MCSSCEQRKCPSVLWFENDLSDRPGHIYNMGESDFRVINKAGKVHATKTAKKLCKLTSGEEG
jgi:hypothetical protein